MTDKILIVDDEPNNLDVLRNCLNEAGFKVPVVESGETALKLVDHIKPDLILLDVMMPGMDGFETCRRLKQNEVTKDTPIIFITAKTESVDKIEGFEVGAVDYITKPFQAVEVIARVNKHLTIRNLQKQLEAKNAQLQESEAKYRLLIENMPKEFIIYSHNTKGVFSFLSNSVQDVLGYTPEEFMIHYTNHLTDNPQNEKVRYHSELSRQGIVQPSYEVEIYCKDGSIKTLEVSEVPTFDDQSKVVSVEGFAHDITERKQTEIALKQANEQAEKARHIAEMANQAKSTFLASMSHELRTPLNGILGYAQILQRDTEITTKQQHGLNVIEQSGNHLLALINDVLDLAKVESGKVELHEVDFHLPSLLNEVSEIINIRAQDKSINFYLESVNDLPNGVHGDERRLRQILLNLLGNAIKFTEHGSVTLKVCMNADSPACSPNLLKTCSPGSLHFKIEDTGVGISPENLETIFEPFEQVGEQERQAKGTGLGLAISKNLVELMGGQLYVSSQINVGTQFWFELTLPTVNYHVTQISTQQPIIGVKGKSPKILVVDDNEENQAVVIDLLSPLGFKVESANDGREGLEKAISWQPDAIITDLIMPEMDGFELIHQLRQSPILKDKIIIASSVNVYDADKNRSLAIGSHAFLPKPIQVETLLEQLQQHLNLTWVYFDKIDKIKETAEENHITQVVFPPIAELEKLYKLTLMGDVNGLQEQIAILAVSSMKLKPFVTKVQAFLKSFQLGELGEWLEGEISHAKTQSF
jgi:PAS domain S-box-containing protein